MSEKLDIQPESVGNHHEKHSATSERQHKTAEHQTAKGETAAEQAEKLKSLRQEVSREARGAEELQNTEASREHTSAHHHGPVKKQLQALMRDRTLNRVRKQLPAPQRAFSKLVHSKPIEAVSEASEKTIARPYGLFGGGLAALIGSGLAYYLARNYGFEYNMFLFFSLFVGGYVLATIVEMTVKTIARKR